MINMTFFYVPCILPKSYQEKGVSDTGTIIGA